MRSKSRLYDLLPAYVRFQDQRRRDQGLDIAPLEALVRSLEVTFDALEANIGALYEGWFVETCEDWRIPYLADLLGIRGLEDATALLPSQRSRVANTIAYRRRKGTPEVLGRAAQDNTGWPCHIKVFRDYLGVTQSMRSSRAERGRTVDVRQRQELDLLRSPFDRHAHTVDLRSGPPKVSADSSGGYHPQRLGLTFWRLTSYPIRHAQARPSQKSPGRFYRFHPAGVDTPLFNPPRTVNGQPSDPTRHLPLPVTRRALAAELADSRFASGDRATVGIQVQNSPAAAPARLPTERIAVADLSTWPTDWPDIKAEVLIDPETGRLAFSEDNLDRIVLLEFCFGQAADLGGGPYPRPSARQPTEPGCWHAVVDQDGGREESNNSEAGHFTSLIEAFAAWRAADSPAKASFKIRDSGLHDLGDLSLNLSENSHLHFYAEERQWPLITGRLTIGGASGSRLRLDGLAMRGKVTLTGETSLDIDHCTLLPLHPEEAAEIAELDSQTVLRGTEVGNDTKVAVRHSVIYGSVRLPADLRGLLIADSIVGSGHGVALAGQDDGFGPPATLDRSTLLGAVKLHQLKESTNTLFAHLIEVERSREGHVRYCYLPNESKVPARFQSLEGPPVIYHDDVGDDLATVSSSAFASLVYGQPAFAQLSLENGGIDQGGEQGNEIGAYHGQRLGDRLANLNAALDEFLPAGFTARIAFAT